MKIDVNRVSAYLAGNFPPYYETFPKIEFILKLSAKAEKVFPSGRFDLIEKHTDSLQQFFSESLNLLKNHTELLQEIIEDLEIPFEARGSDFVQPRKSEKKSLEFEEKTIGFITPFDGEKDITQEFIQNILKEDFPEWDIKVAELKKENGRYLWESIEAFLHKYPVYLADIRDKNLNVSLEIGYLLGDRKDDSKIVFLIDEDEKISDLQGMIRIAKKENNSKAGEKPEKAAERQQEINNDLKQKIKKEFEYYLK